jgi:hypothetical protein
MNNIALLISVGLIGVAIGFALGMVVASFRPVQGERTQVKTDPVAARIEAPSPGPAAPPAEPVPVKSESGEVPTSPKPAQRPSVSPVNLLARALQSEVRSPQPPPMSIAAQIDEILQEKLETSPLNSKAIRLLELPGKGMVVMVGLDQYEGVDAVPDEEIQNLIRSAVAEWERRVSE